MLELTQICFWVSWKPHVHAAVGMLFILSAVVLRGTTLWLWYNRLRAVAASVFFGECGTFYFESSILCVLLLLLSLSQSFLWGLSIISVQVRHPLPLTSLSFFSRDDCAFHLAGSWVWMVRSAPGAYCHAGCGTGLMLEGFFYFYFLKLIISGPCMVIPQTEKSALCMSIWICML